MDGGINQRTSIPFGTVQFTTFGSTDLNTVRVIPPNLRFGASDDYPRSLSKKSIKCSSVWRKFSPKCKGLIKNHSIFSNGFYLVLMEFEMRFNPRAFACWKIFSRW